MRSLRAAKEDLASASSVYDRCVPQNTSERGANDIIRGGGAVAWTSIEELFERTFGDGFRCAHFALLKKTENERAEVKEFIERAFRLMAISKVLPENVAPSIVWILGVMISGLLPGAWNNVVPPFTHEDRHQLINRYLADNPWAEFPEVPSCWRWDLDFHRKRRSMRRAISLGGR